MEPSRLPAITLSPSQVSTLERSFSDLITALGRHANLDIRALRDFTQPIPAGCQRVSLRCDMAGDPAWTLPLARMAARYAVPMTVLVNAREAYFADDHWLDALLVAGPEIALKIIAWMAEDAAPQHADKAVAAAINRLRDGSVNLQGLAFDPPCWGVAAESFELFQGFGLAGRKTVRLGKARLPLQTLDLHSLNIRYTSQFGVARPATPEQIHTYFDLTTASPPHSSALRHAYWANNPVWQWTPMTTIALSANGAWVRYRGNDGDYPVPHRDVGALVEWIAATGPGDRYLFVIDPRLLAA
ncbi:MAG: hypothetical protein HY055_05865 [Magnetospirillum sp.]|nr:hypothetical protein [Magnetospirillum sp.]